MQRTLRTLAHGILVMVCLLAGVLPVSAQNPNCACAECGRSCDLISIQGHKPGCSFYVAPKSRVQGGAPYGPSPQVMMMQSILQPLFANLFTPPTASAPGQSAAEKRQAELARQQAEAARQAAERAKKAALNKWLTAQNDDEIRRQAEQQEKIERGNQLLSQMQTVGGGKLEPFSLGGAELKMKPLSRGNFSTARLSEFDRLMCAAFFSNMASQNTSAVDARFYADQAERVMAGDATFVDCSVSKVGGEAFASRAKSAKAVFVDMQVKTQDLQTITSKLAQARKKVSAAKARKEQAAATLNAASQGRSEGDNALIAKARQELAAADAELRDTAQAEQTLAGKKQKVEEEIERLKPSGQTNAGR